MRALAFAHISHWCNNEKFHVSLVSILIHTQRDVVVDVPLKIDTMIVNEKERKNAEIYEK